MKIDVQKIRDVSEGIIQKVDSNIRPPNSLYLGVNVFFDMVLGRAVLRDGTALLGDQIANGKSALGLHTHITTGGTIVPLSVWNAANDLTSVLYKYTAGAWSSAKTGLTADAKMRFLTYLNTTLGLNGTDKITSADGSTWVTTGGNLDVGNMPAGKFAIEFLDKVYLAGVAANPDRVYISSLPTAGAISWTVDDDQIDVEPEEGAGALTGFAKVPGYVLMFKERSMKRWDGVSTFPESLMNIGALSQEAIVMARQSVIFYNPNRGMFETTGALPRLISRRIQDVVNVVPASYYPNISGGSDGTRVYFSIGDITLGDLSLPNCVIAYSLDYSHFTLLSFPNEFKVWSHRVGNNKDEVLIGADDDGNVWDMFTQVGDGAGQSPFNWVVQWEELEFGSRGRYKEIARSVIYTKDVRNGQVSVRSEDATNFKPIGNISKNVVELMHSLRARYFDIRIQGRGKTGQIIGIDFPDMNVNDTYTS